LSVIDTGLDNTPINPVIVNYTLVSQNNTIRVDRLYGNNLVGNVDFMPDRLLQMSDDLNTIENAVSVKNEADDQCL